MVDGLKAFKKGYKGEAKHLKGKQNLKDYKSEDKTTKEEEAIRDAILHM